MEKKKVGGMKPIFYLSGDSTYQELKPFYETEIFM